MFRAMAALKQDEFVEMLNSVWRLWPYQAVQVYFYPNKVSLHC